MIAPVRTGRDLNAFIRVPAQIQAADPAWVPPLWLERRLHLSRFNPYFQHAEWQAWVARIDGRPVGRISAQIDRLHRQRHGNDSGHFGFFDVDDPGVGRMLLAQAEGWLRERGTKRVTGPFNFSINQECGLLVEGFDTPPAIMMPHGRPEQSGLLESCGYRPARDLLAYWVKVDFDPPRAMTALLNRYGPRVTIRPLDRRRMAEEMEVLRDIFNDAWAQNWGFVPITREEFAELGRGLRLFVPDELVQIAEFEGRPVAFIVALPNINEVLREIGGRMFPAGWLRLLQRLRRREIGTGRVPLMGVRQQYQDRPVGMALAFLVIEAVRKALLARGILEVEMSWILEDNRGMRSILDSIGSRIYKRYRIYEKVLA